MLDGAGNLCSHRSSIAEVFASFYEQLYGSLTHTGECDLPPGISVAATSTEVRQAVKHLKNKKACAADGLVAEMLKHGSEELYEAIALLFTCLLSGQTAVPAEWRQSRLTVIFKKGDPKLPKNYRPISIFPVLEKCFCVFLLQRICDKLEEHQPLEQFGFRRHLGCVDAVHVLQMLREKSSEWGEQIWLASLDLEKAFDKVLHEAVFDSLVDISVDYNIIWMLRSLYSHQCAHVQLDTDTRSRIFEILRGVRQGDPLSPALFNNVTAKMMRPLKARWEAKRFGTVIGCDSDLQLSRLQADRLTSLSFADDTTLIANSRASLTHMFNDIMAALPNYGLCLNLDKCSIQTIGCLHGPTPASIQINGGSIPIISADSGFKVLGCYVSLSNGIQTELNFRMSAAWAKFHTIKAILLRRRCSIKRRLRLFEGTVTKTALWCCETWNLSRQQLRYLDTTRNAMLRLIVVTGRLPDEDWVSWVQRSTRHARAIATEAGLTSWPIAHLQQKWVWAGKVARMSADSLPYRVTFWRDVEWQRGATHSDRPKRPQRGKPFRWEDGIQKFALFLGWRSWRAAAQDETTWNARMQSFATFLL